MNLEQIREALYKKPEPGRNKVSSGYDEGFNDGVDAAGTAIEQRIAMLTAERDELAAFVIEVGGFWGKSHSLLTGESSLAEVINRAFKENEEMHARLDARVATAHPAVAPVVVTPMAWLMVHKTGIDRGLTWHKDDSRFSDEWDRVPLVAGAPLPEQGRKS